MKHVAVLRAAHLRDVLSGAKRIESRLARVRCAPFGRVAAGDVLHLKESSGPYRATARVERVRCLADLTPARVRDLAKRYNGLIQGPKAYWREKESARFATLIWLVDVAPTSNGPAIPPLCGRGWLCLDDRALARRARVEADSLAAA